MNGFEKFLLSFTKAVVAAAPTVATVFIHSNQGIAVFNASETLATGMIEQFSTDVPATPGK